MRRWALGWMVGGLAFAGMVTGCGLLERVMDDEQPTTPATATASEVTFKQPVEFRGVTEVVATKPCATGFVEDAEGVSCYRLADETLTIKRVKSLKTEFLQDGSGGHAILLALESDDARAFADLTERLAAEQPPGNQLAVLVDGKVVTAPMVQSAITGGEVQIVGNFSKADADQLVRRLTG